MNSAAEKLAPRPVEPLRVSVNASVSLVGNTIYALCQAGLLIALARLGDPSRVGQFALGLAVSTPILLLTGLQLRSVQVTDAGRRNAFSEYLGLRLVTVTVALSAIFAAALILGRTAGGSAVIVLVGISKSTEAVSDVYRGLMQQCERMDRVALSLILRGVVALPAFTLVLLSGSGLIAALAALAISNALVWRIWDVQNVRRFLGGIGESNIAVALFGVSPRLDQARLRTIASSALPLGIVAMLLSLNTYAPQYVLKTYHGEAELGIFAALLYAAMAGQHFIGAAGQAASPRLAKLYHAGELRAFERLHARLLAFAFVTGATMLVVAVLFGRRLLHLVFGMEYAQHASLLVAASAVLAISNLVSAQGYAVTAARRFREQLPVAACIAVTTVSTALILVPPLGARGAIAALLAGALVQGAGYMILLRRSIRDAQLCKYAGRA